MTTDNEQFDAARSGDERAFRALIEPYRARLHAHCYRMLASLADADDALQETLLGAWQGIHAFEGRSSLQTWLYTIATHACLRIASKRPSRRLPSDDFPTADPRAHLDAAIDDGRWIDPYPDASLEALENVEIAFIATLQSLPATQRAAVILRDVLGFSAAETATALDASVPAINSALQRARETLAAKVPPREEATRRSLRDEFDRALVDRFIDAWRRGDVDGIIAMLAENATFTMPPLPGWFHGRSDIATFLRTHVFVLRWRFVECRASGQPAMAAYRWSETSSSFELEVINVFTVRSDNIDAITAFPNRALCERFGLPLSV